MKLFLASCTLFFGIFANSQTNGKITYNVTFERNTVLDDKPIPVKTNPPYIENSTKQPTIFFLWFNGDKALFEAEYDLPTKRQKGFTFDRTAMAAMHERTYYYDSSLNQGFFQSFFLKEYLVSFDDVHWVYTNETKEIGGYTCYKAVTEIKTEQIKGFMNYTKPIEAWYTPEIPVHFGVQLFNGLPGLTMELTAGHKDGTVTYHATTIELGGMDAIIIDRPKGDKTISYEDYPKRFHERYKNRF